MLKSQNVRVLISATGLAVMLGVTSAGAFPVITNVVETGGDNEPTDTVTAKWTGVTYVGGIANEPVPGLPAGASYTVGLFDNHAPAFVDRNHRYTNALPALIPSYLVGQEYIMSGNDNRDNTGYRLDVFVAQNVIAYLLIDNRLGDASGANPPTFDATHMQWVLDDGWLPVMTGVNRSSNATLPDEVGIDESADGTINQYYSVYRKAFLAGTFVLRQADNAGQNMYGVVIVPSSPPSPPTNLAIVSGDGKITLNWTASGGATGYIVKRSLVSGGPYDVLATNATTSYMDTTVINGTQYYYVVSAISIAGESADSAEVSGIPKAAPTGVVAVGGVNQVQVSWDAFPGAATYTVARSSNSGGPYSTVATGISETSYLDTMLESGRVHYYVVVAQLTGGGDSGQSSEAAGLTAPSAPTLSASIWASTVIRLSWTTTDSVVSQYFVEQSTDGTTFAPLATVPGTQRSYTNDSLTLGTTYFYRVQAQNASGTSGYSTVASATTPTFGINVNFAAGAGNSAGNPVAPVPIGYVQDIGLLYGDQGNGFTYGWDRDIHADGRYRQAANSPDLRYDTFMHLIKATPPAIWNIAIPNGFYSVHIVAGDPSNTDSVFQFDVEGVLTATVTPGGPGSFNNNWADFTLTCAISDGQLTIKSGPNSQTLANNNKIAFIDIYSAVPVPPVIGSQPQGQTVEEFRPVSLTVGLSSGSTPFAFQWYRNGDPVAGATSQTLTFAHVLMSDAGNYSVVVSNYAGAVTSDVATLTVQPDITAPAVLSVASLDGLTIGICFSEEMSDSNDALHDSFSYLIQSDAGGSLIDSITIRPDFKSVAIHLASAISGSFQVTVSSVIDLAGHEISGAGAVGMNVVKGYFAGDVGTPGLAGSHFTCDGENIEIVGGGADVWGTSDQFYLVSTSANGDFDARVRVTGLSGANAITKAVLVARENNNADARALHISVNPVPPGRNQTEFGQRTTTTGATAGIGSSFIPAGVPNAWMRITRVGDLFSGYHGSNGVDWILFGTTTQVYPSTMAVGIGVTAHDNTLLATGMFSNFQISQVINRPTLAAPSFNGTDFSASFQTQAAVTYRVEYKDTLSDPSWTLLTTISGDGTAKTFVDSSPAAATRFYQIRIQ